MKKVILFLFLLVPFSLLAEDDFYQKSGTAIKGYDVVAYFTDNQAIAGGEDISYEYGGVNWWFSSAENLALFQASPEKYLPQYGGWCAYAMAVSGNKVPIKPSEFLVTDGKLYLNFNRRISRKFQGNLANYITAADKHWLEIQAK